MRTRPITPPRAEPAAMKVKFVIRCRILGAGPAFSHRPTREAPRPGFRIVPHGWLGATMECLECMQLIIDSWTNTTDSQAEFPDPFQPKMLNGFNILGCAAPLQTLWEVGGPVLNWWFFKFHLLSWEIMERYWQSNEPVLAGCDSGAPRCLQGLRCDNLAIIAWLELLRDSEVRLGTAVHNHPYVLRRVRTFL
jgi:hypothetical protein